MKTFEESKKEMIESLDNAIKNYQKTRELIINAKNDRDLFTAMVNSPIAKPFQKSSESNNVKPKG